MTDKDALLLLSPGAIIDREKMSVFLEHQRALSDAKAEGARIIAEAHSKADEIVETMRADAKVNCDSQIEAVTTQAQDIFQSELSKLEGDVSKLVGRTVKAVIGELDTDEAIKRATRTALEQLCDHKVSRIHAARSVVDLVAETVAEDKVTQGIEVLVDETLEGDRVIVKSDRAISEIGLSEQLAAATAPWQGSET